MADVSTYLEREKIIVRIGREFEDSVVEHICFSGLDPMAFGKMFAEMDGIGVTVAEAVCLRPTFRQRLGESWRRVSCKWNRAWRRRGVKVEETSVV